MENCRADRPSGEMRYLRRSSYKQLGFAAGIDRIYGDGAKGFFSDKERMVLLPDECCF
jgi:hypothetical protein